MAKKKIVSVILSVLLIVSSITVAVSAPGAQAASIKYVAGNAVKGGAKPYMYVKMSDKKIRISGCYGVGKSETKAFNTYRKRPAKTYKIAGTCTVQTGDDILEIMGYDLFRESYGDLFGPTIILKIKNNKVVKIKCIS